ncbi:unnamed protein product [Gordionus sp. m RMFG-2023]
MVYDKIFQENLSEDDANVVNFIKDNFMVQVIESFINIDFSMGQSEIVYRYYKKMEELAISRPSLDSWGSIQI